MHDHSAVSHLPPFSPTLLAGLLLRPLPVRMFSPLARHILRNTERLYPEIFDRLTDLGHCRFHIIATDIPFSFLVTLDHGRADIELLAQDQTISTASNATISGPLLSLIALLEGQVDGDALFFSRDLTVEGDTEAVLTLRNAVDSADISFAQICSGQTGPLKPIFAAALSRISSLYQRAHKDLEYIHKSVTQPLNNRISQLETELDRHEEQRMQMEKEIRRMRAAGKGKTNRAETI